jgi:hypothetical protein
MIIKALPVKSGGGVGSTITYIAKDKGRIADYRNQGIFHNLSSTRLNEIITQFSNNYEEYAKKRSNGNRALHTILSVNPLDRNIMTLSIMDSIVRHYLETAYPRALAFGTHHITENHWHTHLLISANEVMSYKSTRLSKADLKAVHHEMLEYMRTQHPELTIGINEAAWGQKIHNEREYFMEKREPEVKHIKELLAEKIQGIFRTSENSQQFIENVKQAGFQTYEHKDKPFGVYYGEDNHKMRFSRLGIDEDQIAELDKQDIRLQELESIRDEQEKETELEVTQEAEIRTIER